jgi:glycosyltransferase involved in cell wall biosynthesis
VHLISSVGVGGAETALVRLLSLTDRAAWSPRVVSMTGEGALSEQIRALGVPVTSLGMRRGEPAPRGLVRLRRLLARERPTLLQTWMYHADLLGLVAAAGICPTVWNVRHSELAPEGTRRLTRLSAWLCARLSRRARAIVVGSEAARRAHVALGYHPSRMVLIPNGFDTAVFRPDAAARARVRAELGIAADAPVVGMVARLHPDKGHALFLEAAGRIAAAEPDAVFVLCGAGVTAQALRLPPGLEGRVRPLGVRGDVPAVLAACDVAVSASVSEGFPNAVGEAMACAVPCVVTDVGDAALLVGDAGVVVPPRDAPALASAVLGLLAMPPARRQVLGERARSRVAERFSLASTAAAYARLHAAVAAGGGRRVPAGG